MNQPAQTTLETIQVSVREARMAVERTLMTCGIAKGYVPAVRDCVLLSQSMGLAGFEGLLGQHAALSGADLTAIQLLDFDQDPMLLDGGGLHAWLVLPGAVDIGVAAARTRGSSTLRLVNVAHFAELQIAQALASRYATVAEVHPGQSETVIKLCNGPRPHGMAQWDPHLHQAIRHGYTFGRQRWREIYALSNKALAPDSVTSRRHAGPVLVDAAGQIVGRTPVDDETDLRTLTHV